MLVSFSFDLLMLLLLCMCIYPLHISQGWALLHARLIDQPLHRVAKIKKTFTPSWTDSNFILDNSLSETLTFNHYWSHLVIRLRFIYPGKGATLPSASLTDPTARSLVFFTGTAI